jgi:gamma-tubulin complex component 2
MQFLDLAEDELRKSVEDIIETKLTSLLELALRTSSLADPYKDSIKVQLFPHGIRQQMIDITSVISKQTVDEDEPVSLTMDHEVWNLHTQNLLL